MCYSRAPVRVPPWTYPGRRYFVELTPEDDLAMAEWYRELELVYEQVTAAPPSYFTW